MNDSSHCKVLVSGCFDILHSGHVTFLNEAASHGELYVGVGSDATVRALKGADPVCSEQERLSVVSALRCVHGAFINSGHGLLDFEPDLTRIRPQVFYVNQDGDHPSKRTLCDRLGITYVVGKQPDGLSSTALKMPWRLDIAGGWLDQPALSRLCAGPVITASLQPTHLFDSHSGMASSTRLTALKLWPRLPSGNRETMAQLLFAAENMPGKAFVSGAQDAFGMLLPGVNRLHFDGGWLPSRVERTTDPKVIEMLEHHVCLVPVGKRPMNYDPWQESLLTHEKAVVLSNASEACWLALRSHDLSAFAQAVNMSREAQVSIFPKMLSAEMREQAAQLGAIGWKVSGSGGGGYLIIVAHHPPEHAIRIRVNLR